MKVVSTVLGGKKRDPFMCLSQQKSRTRASFAGLFSQTDSKTPSEKKSKLEKMRLFIPPKGKKLAIFSPLSRYNPRREIKTDRNRPSFPFCIFYEPPSPFAFHHHQPVFALPIGQLFTHHSVGQLRKAAGCTASMRVRCRLPFD